VRDQVRDSLMPPRAVRKHVVFVLQSNGINPKHLPVGVIRPRHGRPTKKFEKSGAHLSGLALLVRIVL
jgi:hypothetical protein